MRPIFLCIALAGCTAATGEPARPVVVVESSYCPIFPQPHFASGSVDVDPSVAEQMAQALAHHPAELASVEVSGHASEDEPDAGALSLRRAQAFRDALVARGVPRERLRARGYGAVCSLGDEGDAGRAKDRRVEFRILRTRAGATGAEVGCADAPVFTERSRDP